MNKITIDQKRKYIEKRNQGYTIKRSGQEAELSYTSARDLERMRNNGSLQREILRSQNNVEDEEIYDVLHSGLQELRRRDIRSLTNNQLIQLISRLPTVMKQINKGSGEEMDELDQIYAQIVEENQQQTEGE